MLKNILVRYKTNGIFKYKLDKFSSVKFNEDQMLLKIFSVEELDRYISFLEFLMKYDVSSNQAVYRLEKEIYNYLYLNKKFSKYITESSAKIENEEKDNYYPIQRKKLVMNSSHLLEKFYINKLYCNTITEFSKIMFLIMINFYDISVRKLYPYFNINIIFYYISNPNYDILFKRLVVSHLITNIDLLKFSQLISLIKFSYEHKNLKTFYLLNLNGRLDTNILNNYFDPDKIQKNYTINDLSSACELFDLKNYPDKEKFFIINNVLLRLKYNFDEKTETSDLLMLNKSLKQIQNYKKFVFDNINQINELKIKVESKLKYRLKTTAIDVYHGNLNNFLHIIDEFILYGVYIDDKAIIDELLNIINKCSDKNEYIKENLIFIFQRFIDLYPVYISKILFSYWKDLIFLTKVTVCNKISISIMKSVISTSFNSLLIKENNAEISLLKNFILGMYTDFDSISKVGNIGEYIEMTFYMTYLKVFNMCKIENEEFLNFLTKHVMKIINFFQGKNIRILNSQLNHEKNNQFDFGLIEKDRETVCEFLQLMCLYVNSLEIEKLFNDAHLDLFKSFSNELNDYINEFRYYETHPKLEKLNSLFTSLNNKYLKIDIDSNIMINQEYMDIFKIHLTTKDNLQTKSILIYMNHEKKSQEKTLSPIIKEKFLIESFRLQNYQISIIDSNCKKEETNKYILDKFK